MIRVIAICAFVGLLMSLGAVATEQAASQRFPYEAPQAPEFDDRGKPISSGADDDPEPDYRPSGVRPTAPRTPPAVSPPSPPPVRRDARRVPATAARPQVPDSQPPQPQEPPDCSQFPGLIATAQDPNQMRWYARQYLTCLMKRGWRMPQARQEVIRIIEASQSRGR
ncbi:MAG: hypothetical protein RDU20_12590 [Desulfomonilaceae bacterium]|nr:hypothetical protein [Desulfomonilaceae bacterium]